MGKRSKRNRVKQGKAAPPEEEPLVPTLQEVRALPLATRHVWKLLVFGPPPEPFGALAVMDMTNTILGLGEIARMMRMCEYPDSSSPEGASTL